MIGECARVHHLLRATRARRCIRTMRSALAALDQLTEMTARTRSLIAATQKKCMWFFCCALSPAHKQSLREHANQILCVCVCLAFEFVCTTAGKCTTAVFSSLSLPVFGRQTSTLAAESFAHPFEVHAVTFRIAFGSCDVANSSSGHFCKFDTSSSAAICCSSMHARLLKCALECAPNQLSLHISFRRAS